MNQKNLIISVILVIIASASIFFIFNKEAKITNFPSSGEKIVALGDSLIQGVGATQGNDLVSVLSKKIGEPIINLGISGNTSADGLARIDTVKAQNPKVVLVLLGGNDFLRRIEREETFRNIDQIVSELQKQGAVVILLGVQGGILTDSYEKYFEEIAQKRRTLYVPNVLDGIIGKRELMSDSIHPNDAGYKKIAEKIYPVLERALP